MPGIFRTVIERQAFRLCQNDIVPWIRINKRCNVRVITPAGRAVLDIVPILLRIPAFLLDQQPEKTAEEKTE